MKQLLPPTYFMILLVTIFGLNFFIPLTRIIIQPYNYLGLILIIFGIIINLWTDKIFKDSKTTVKPYEMPSVLITGGPFSLSRHPMYFGMFLILLGTAIILGSLINFIPVIVFIVIIETKFISKEEKNLEKKFGKKYLDYKKKTRKWI